MDKYQQTIQQLKSAFTQPLWNQLLKQLQNQGKSIAIIESKNPSQISLFNFAREQTLKPKQKWFLKLNQMIKIIYERRKQLIKIVYRLLPVLMQKYIQINFLKYQGLQQCLINIYNYEYKSFNEAQTQKSQLSKDIAMKNLYQSHLGKQMIIPTTQILNHIQQVNNASRINLKSLMFYIIYRQAQFFGDQPLSDYYKALFIYCGADEKEINSTGSLYLLERTNKVSIFRYSISQEQLQWIILTLYELSTQVKKDKYELLAVIYIIHKKVSNESLFKLSDVANSLIHLLQDQYSQIFI